MKIIFISALLTVISISGCGVAEQAAENTASSPTPVAISTPKDGDYPGRGKVTRIKTELASIELEHDEIIGVMPAMTMEFFVTDKALLNGLRIGDTVDFTLRVKGPTETISAVKKLP